MCAGRQRQVTAVRIVDHPPYRIADGHEGIVVRREKELSQLRCARNVGQSECEQQPPEQGYYNKCGLDNSAGREWRACVYD